MKDLISRQEAIDAIENKLDQIDHVPKWVFDALTEALEMLPSAQVTQNNRVNSNNALDTISRQAAIDALDALCDRECEYSKKQRNVMCGACHLGSAFDVVEQLPSAETERKKGEWIKKWRNGFGNEIGRCNQCGRAYEVSNFCPNCGTDMRGEVNG